MAEGDRGDGGEGNLFEQEARQKRTGLAGEMTGMLRQNRKWWLIPILAAVLILGVLLILAGTGVAPFIYTLF